MADLALGVVKDIVKTGMAIKEAVDTVHQNEEECQDLRLLVATLIAILSRLQRMGLMSHPAMCGALVGLHGSLDRALKLVTKCQKRNGMHRFLTAGDMAKQLRRVHDDIQRKMQLGNLAITASMMEVTIELTRTTIVRYDGAHPLPIQPQQDAGEMEIYASHSTAGDSGTVEYDAETITMVATGTEAPSAPSSGVTKFSLSETVATHHVSEENVNGGSSYTIVSKETVTLNLQLHCAGCGCRIKRRIRKIEGVNDVALDITQDLVKVTGTMDVVALQAYLREKLKRPVEVVEPAGKKIRAALKRDEYVRLPPALSATEEEAPPRWLRPRSSGRFRAVTAKLFGFMRLRPRSRPRQALAAPPSSSPLLIEHTDTPWSALPTAGESSSSITIRGTATPQACIHHQCQDHAAGDLIFENGKPDLRLRRHQPAQRTFDMRKVHRRVRLLPTLRRPRAARVEASPARRSGARVLRPFLLVPCVVCALVLLATVGALRYCSVQLF